MSTKRRRVVEKHAREEEEEDDVPASVADEDMDVQLDDEINALIARAPGSSGHGVAYDRESSFRQPREAEARKLDELNKRCHYIMMVNRERDSYFQKGHAELTEYRKDAAAVTSRIRDEHESKLIAMRQEYEERNDSKPLKAEIQRLARLIEARDRTIAEAEEDRERDASRIRGLNERVKADQGKISELEDQVRVFGAALSDKDAELGSAGAADQRQRASAVQQAKALGEATADNAALRKQVGALKKDLNDMRQAFDTKSREHAESEAGKLERERELRDSFGKQLNSIVEEIRARSAKEISQLKANADEAMNEELAVLRKEVADRDAQLAAAEKRAAAQDTALLKLRSEATMLAAKNATLEAETEKAGEDLQKVQALFDDREVTCNKYAARLTALEAEYSELIGIKIDINKEIMRYRGLLEEEESRLQVSGKSSANKRDIFAESSPSTAYGDKTNNMVFVSSDIGDQVVRLKNGHSEPIELAGFVLKSKGSSFKFPDAVVQPNAVVAVYFGKDSQKRATADKANDAFSAPKFSFGKHDSATLVDSYGRNVSQIDVFDN
jgi:hypothetical protein